MNARRSNALAWSAAAIMAGCLAWHLPGVALYWGLWGAYWSLNGREGIS